MSDVSQIDGAAVRCKRESLGWVINDLATRACLSVKQIRQIEEGGMSAFYSESVKLTAAKKVALLLNMTEAQLFGQELPAHAHTEEVMGHDDNMAVLIEKPPLTVSSVSQPPTHHVPIMRSEALHVLAQPPEHVEEESHDSPAPLPDNAGNTAQRALSDPAGRLSSDLPSAVSSDDAPVNESASKQTEPTSGGSNMLKILALFVLALAAAALVQFRVLEKKTDTPALDTTPLPVPAESPNALPFNSSPEPAKPGDNGTPETVSAPSKPTASEAMRSTPTASSSAPSSPSAASAPTATSPATAPAVSAAPTVSPTAEPSSSNR